MNPGRSAEALIERPLEAADWLGIASSLKPYLIVFTASACTLILEIVAARILAAEIGVSLYTWTSIIGVILAGISAGNYLGGRVADRFPSPATIGLILLAGGVSSLSVLFLLGVSSEAYESMEIRLRIIFLTATLFFLPALILGMVTPVVIKLRLQDLNDTGNVVGQIYAISTVGSIFGVFITGFFLIQWIGSRETILLVAIVLVTIALALGNLWQVRIASFPLIGLSVLLGTLSFTTGTLDSGCTRESNYFCIRVSDSVDGGQPVKVLELDNLLHSYVSLEDPTLLVYDYEKIFADIAAYVVQQDPSPRVLFIGGGGYTMPRYMEALYPQSTLEVIEIDPEVTDVAFDLLGLRPDTRILTYNEDARMAVPKLPRGQYDLVVGDAFASDASVPFHLTTREFNEDVRALLKDDGIYAVNVIDKLRSGRFLRSYVNTLQRTFPHVYLISDEAKWDEDILGTYVMAASSQPLSPSDLEQANSQEGRSQLVSHFMPEDTFRSWLNSSGKVLLTDNHAPVDNLMAPIYLARAAEQAGFAEAERHLYAGVELAGQGRIQEAIAEYDEAIRLQPESFGAYNNRAVAYDSLGQSERAIQDYAEAIRLDPEEFVTYYNRSLIYRDLGLLQQAIEDLDEAIRLNPQYPDAYFYRGLTYRDLGQFRQAIEDLDEAIRLDPRDPDGYASRALAYTGLGEDAQAQEDFDRAVELGYDPTLLREEIDEISNQP